MLFKARSFRLRVTELQPPTPGLQGSLIRQLWSLPARSYSLLASMSLGRMENWCKVTELQLTLRGRGICAIFFFPNVCFTSVPLKSQIKDQEDYRKNSWYHYSALNLFSQHKESHNWMSEDVVNKRLEYFPKEIVHIKSRSFSLFMLFPGNSTFLQPNTCKIQDFTSFSNHFIFRKCHSIATSETE